MDTYKINEFLLELVQQASEELLKIYFNNPSRRTLLKFPYYRDKNEKRISEQELRFVLISIHDQNKFPDYQYSIETPTLEKYTFKGSKKRSAASDLSFYFENEKVLNLELKARNPQQESIDKDIEKLVTENCNGAWIHILKNEDKGTVKTLFKKFIKSFENLGPSKRPISFHILILETQTLLSRKGKVNENDYSENRNIFNINYHQWNKMKPGKYQYRNGILKAQDTAEDWQVDIFDINDCR
jgi:hypothetical protein